MRSPGLCTIWGKELWADSRSFFQGRVSQRRSGEQIIKNRWAGPRLDITNTAHCARVFLLHCIVTVVSAAGRVPVSLGLQLLSFAAPLLF